MIILSNDDGLFEATRLRETVEFMESVKNPEEWLLQEIDTPSPLRLKFKEVLNRCPAK